MAEPENTEPEEPEKRSRKPLLIGLVLALVLGCGGFYAVWSGMILTTDAHGVPDEQTFTVDSVLPDVVFVPIKPLVVNIGTGAVARHLRFQAQLEVKRSAEEDVTLLLPRVVDVLNGYLRAIDTAELEQRTALVRLRAQMLRRVQIVTGEGRVKDLLIMEFVLN